MSDPQGPVYLWARRETMEEEVDENVVNAPVRIHHWYAIQPAGLNPVGKKNRTIYEIMN